MRELAKGDRASSEWIKFESRLKEFKFIRIGYDSNCIETDNELLVAEVPSLPEVEHREYYCHIDIWLPKHFDLRLLCFHHSLRKCYYEFHEFIRFFLRMLML